MFILLFQGNDYSLPADMVTHCKFSLFIIRLLGPLTLVIPIIPAYYMYSML